MMKQTQSDQVSEIRQAWHRTPEMFPIGHVAGWRMEQNSLRHKAAEKGLLSL